MIRAAYPERMQQQCSLSLSCTAHPARNSAFRLLPLVMVLHPTGPESLSSCTQVLRPMADST